MLEAETELKIAEMDGESVKALADAEQKSNQYLAKYRKFRQIDEALKVYESLADNPDLVISDTSDAGTNLMLMADR